MAELSFTILGCGSSGGVPRLSDEPGGMWGACDPANPKNRRLRCSVLVTRTDTGGTTRALIDTSPDMRGQLLSANVGTLDAVVFTHSHADHTHGIDDLRMVVFNRRSRLPVWSDGPTSANLLDRFGYAFETPAGSPYPPILDLHIFDEDFEIDGAGGNIRFAPIPVAHGDMKALGFRIGPLSYIPDVSDIPAESWPLLSGLDVLVIDALRYTPHPSHAHLERTLAWISRAAPAQAVLTNMHIDLDYQTLNAETPGNVTPAHDGLTLTFVV